MAYETVHDVLDRARAFHHELGAWFQRMEDIADKERVRMVLDYLRRHEAHMEECLNRYEGEGADRVLDTWYKFTPDEALRESLGQIDLKPDMSPDQVIAAALELDRHLVALYRGMADSAVSEDVRELFTELLALEKREEHRMVRDTIEMNDL